MRTNAVVETILKRRSVRSFTGEQVPEEDLQAILAAGRHAPTARNQQKWHFTVVQSPALLRDLNREAKAVALEVGDAFARQRASTESLNIFYGAPTLIIVSGDDRGNLIQLDCAAANQTMLLAAESLGLSSCWINFLMFVFRGSKADQYKQALGIPAGYTPCCALVLGHRHGEPGPTPDRNPQVVNYVR